MLALYAGTQDTVHFFISLFGWCWTRARSINHFYQFFCGNRNYEPYFSPLKPSKDDVSMLDYVRALTIRLRISMFTMFNRLALNKATKKTCKSVEDFRHHVTKLSNKFNLWLPWVLRAACARSQLSEWRQNKTGYSISNWLNVWTIFYLRPIWIRVFCTHKQFSMRMDARMLSRGHSKFGYDVTWPLRSWTTSKLNQFLFLPSTDCPGSSP